MIYSFKINQYFINIIFILIYLVIIQWTTVLVNNNVQISNKIKILVFKMKYNKIISIRSQINYFTKIKIKKYWTKVNYPI